MQQAVLIVVVVIDQLHDGIEFRAFLDRDAVSDVGADPVVAAAALEGNRQRRRLFAVLHRHAN